MKINAIKQILTPIGAVVLLAVIVLAVRIQWGRAADAPTPLVAPLASPSRPASLADSQMQKAEQMTKRAPYKPDGYNMLCAAYMQKARETGDFSLNSRAEGALNRALEIDPDNFEGIKLRAALLLTNHRFGEALGVAERARQMRPGDHMVYGELTDALVELGDYDKADEAADKMMLLRPDASSYARMAYLDFLHGDAARAIEVMRAAVKSSTPQDPEGLAWQRVHLGDELIRVGKLSEGEREYDLALDLFPDYYVALAAKARARIAAGDLAGAVGFYQRSLDRVPLPDTAIALGDLYASLGRADTASKQYELVEFIERSAAGGANVYSRQLALFWANHDCKLAEALDIASRERQARADIYTCDTLAWCLLKNGKAGEAKAAIEEALRLGTRDAQLYYHAGMIYKALGDRRAAAKHLHLALEINPTFDLLQAEFARKALREL